MAEPKREMKSRGLSSPDEGDSFCGLIHLVRHHSKGFTPGSFKDQTPTRARNNLAKNATVWNIDYGVPDQE